MSPSRRLAHRPAPRPVAGGPTRAGRNERGATIVVVSLMMVPLLILSALVIDAGYAKQRRRLVQASADASALAAVQELDGASGQIDRAVTAAKAWASKNVDELVTSDWVGCRDSGALSHRPDTAADNTCISFDSSTAPTRVRVRIPIEDQPQFFSQVAGVDAFQVSAVATAARAAAPPASSGDCGLCARESMQLSGTQNIQVIGGGTIHTGAMTANWNRSTSTISPCPVKAVSGNQANTKCPPNTNTNPITYVPAAPPDPFASLPAPPTGIPPCRTPQNQPCNINNANDVNTYVKPNVVFTQSVNLSNMTINLAPGNYYFAEGLKLNGNVTLTGTGVTLFFVCANSNQASQACPNGNKGFIEATNGGNNVTITAPTTGPYAGMAIYFDRQNTQGTAPKFSGNGSTYRFNGNIYAYGGKFTGDGSRLVEITGRIFVQYWEDNGGGTTKITYSGGGSSTPGSGGEISLVG